MPNRTVGRNSVSAFRLVPSTLQCRIALRLSALLLCGMLGNAAAAEVFDTPVTVVHAKTPLKHPEPGQKHILTCFYYPGLRVKQLDLGEVGAAQLALLPLKPGAPRIACKESSEPGEIVIPGKEWSGYFDGVKGDWAFFTAEDGTNGGLGFAVFDGHTGRKLFEDLAVGKLRAAEPTPTGLRLRYRRAVAGKCSIPAAGDKCWTQIVATLPGVPATPVPGCKTGYLKAKTAMARGRCEAQSSKTPACFEREMKILDEQRWDEAPSVIGYDVVAEVGSAAAVTKPAGGTLSCWPSD